MEGPVTSYEHTKTIHDTLSQNLKKEEARLQTLLEYERDVALKIEDATRVILAIRRSLATLSAGIPSNATTIEQPPAPTSLREMLHNAAEAERRENYEFSEEEFERRHDENVAAQTEE